MKTLNFLPFAFAAIAQVAFAGDTVGNRLDQMNDLKSRTELARQENQLRDELSRLGSISLPTIVSISGSATSLTARLQVSAGSQRSFSVGDHVGNGFNVIFIKPGEVLVARPASGKSESMKLYPLVFAVAEAQPQGGRPGGTAQFGGPPQFAGPAMPPVSIPPLPAAFPDSASLPK